MDDHEFEDSDGDGKCDHEIWNNYYQAFRPCGCERNSVVHIQQTRCHCGARYDGRDCMCFENEKSDVPSTEEQIEDETFYAKDGCEVEVDGTCPHGFPSMVAGLI